jgi:DNA-binding winged helix-turn-helix (wHTH) protein/tetratricopeptide (TPR) repeat protein
MERRSAGSVARFGAFEVDLRSAELRKHGIRIRLQEQPFQILSFLMERAGEVVTREELRHRLWPDHTFVDFDRSLNKAMTKLRAALGDSAESPRYIETLYRRGYRLLVPVSFPADHASADAPKEHPLELVPVPQMGPVIDTPIRIRPRILKFAAIAFMVLLLVFLYYGRAFHSLAIGRFSSATGPKRSIAVLGFKNLSRDPDQAWLSTALSEWLTTELAAGEQLRTIPAENVARMKMELSLPDSEFLKPTSLQRIRKDLGTDLVVVGSYATLDSKTGDQIRLDLRLQDTLSGETVAAISETGTVSNLFDVVSKAGQNLRSKLGVRAVTREEQQAAEIELPSNPEAARLYSEGLAKLRDFDSLAARDLLQQAISVEPDFALSHSALAATWQRLGYDEAAKEEGKKAFDLSGKLSRSDRLLVEARYREASRDWERAIEIYRALFEFFPDNLDYGLALAEAQVNGEKGSDALVTVQMLRQLPGPLQDDPRIDLADSHAAESQGDYRRSLLCAARAAEKARATGTSLLLAKALLDQAWASENLGDFDKVTTTISESKAVASTTRDLGLVAETLTIEAISLQMMGNFPGAKERYAQALAMDQKIGNLKGVAAGFDNMGDAMYSLGDLSTARRSYENAVTTYRRIAHQDGVGLADVGLGDVLLTMGKPMEATQRYKEAFEICRQLGDRSKAASALLGLGRAQRAEGDLVSATRTELEAKAAYQGIGDALSTARAELVLAHLELDDHSIQQASASTQSAVDAFEKMHSAADAGGAYLLLSEILLSENQVAEARTRIELALKAAETSHQRELSLLTEVGAARVQAASKNGSDVAEALRRLTQTLSAADRAGFRVVALEARLALGEIQYVSLNRATGLAELEAVQRDAMQAGISLIANKAAAILRESSLAAALSDESD